LRGFGWRFRQIHFVDSSMQRSPADAELPAALLCGLIMRALATTSGNVMAAAKIGIDPDEFQRAAPLREALNKFGQYLRPTAQSDDCRRCHVSAPFQWLQTRCDYAQLT
jgi:hypothetical protein